MFNISDNKIIDSIAYCMQDINNTYMLDLETGECITGERPDLVNLPPWSSAQGFRIMSSFAAQCPDESLSEKLNKVLESPSGVFHAFRKVLDSDKKQLRNFYDYKSSAIRSYIRSYIKENYIVSEDLPSPLLAEYDIVFEPFSYPHSDMTEFQKRFSSCLDNTTSCIAKTRSGESAAIISYGTIEDTAYIFYYYVKENRRRRGLFKLILNMALSSFQPKEIKRCFLPYTDNTNFIVNTLISSQNHNKTEVIDIDTERWNSINLSCQTGYVL